MLLRALDLALMMRLYRWFSGQVMSVPLCDLRQEGLARLAIRMENKVTNALIAADTRVCALAATLAGGGYHWSSLLEAKRAQDEGRPLGHTR